MCKHNKYDVGGVTKITSKLREITHLDGIEELISYYSTAMTVS